MSRFPGFDSQLAYQDKLQLGSRVFFDYEPVSYRVRAISPDKRFFICTKPFNPRHSVIYTIIDFDRIVRGPDNMVFGEGYMTQTQIEHRLRQLRSGRIEVSYRRGLPLRITDVKPPTKYDYQNDYKEAE